jgi:hypothetical protein
MAALCLSAWLRFACLVATTALPLPVGFTQWESSDASGFTSVVLATGGDPDAVEVADINHDGSMDIIAANPEHGTVSVLLGDGKGGFRHSPGSPFPAGHLPSDVGIGDFNSDGNPDLLIANHQTPYVTLLLGDGAGRFRAAPGSPFATNAKPHPHGLAVGRFCGKEQPLDAVIDSWGSEEIELLIGDGKGNLRNGPMFPAGPGSDMPLRSADFNRDGLPDIVMPDTAIGRWNANTVSVLLGNGKCGFNPSPGSPFSGGAVPWSVAVGDLNDDGISDIVLIPYGPQVREARLIAATVLLGDGKGGFAPAPGSPLPLPDCGSPRRVAIGSIYGKREHDFAVTCMNSSKVILFRSQKGDEPHTSSLDIPMGNSGLVSQRGVILADLLMRGRDDIIVSNGSAGTITLLLSK